MYIKTGKACGYWYAVAYKDESENERLHRVEYTNAAMQMEWMDALAGSDMEKQIERKGEKLALQKLLDEMVERKQISVAEALAEMAKFMGGETEAPPEPESEKPKLAYAVGDEVLVKGVIVTVDEDDETYPYRVRINNFSISDWVEVEDIAGKASPTADVKEESKPEPKFKVGDKVIHKFRPDWGVGTVKSYTGFVSDLVEYFEYGKYSDRNTDKAYYVEFPYFFVDNEDKKRIEIWTTAEQNLVPA